MEHEEQAQHIQAREIVMKHIRALNNGFRERLLNTAGEAHSVTRNSVEWDEKSVTATQAAPRLEPDEFYVAGMPLFVESLRAAVSDDFPPYWVQATEHLITFADGMAHLSKRTFAYMGDHTLTDMLSIISRCQSIHHHKSPGDAKCLSDRMRLAQVISGLEGSVLAADAAAEHGLRQILEGAKAYQSMCESCPFAEYHAIMNPGKTSAPD